MSAASTMAHFADQRARARDARVQILRASAHQALPDLVGLLVSRGARRVWLFGSLAWGGPHEDSDIDPAVEGMPEDDLWRAQGEALTAAPCGVDLVRTEDVPLTLASRIRASGILLPWVTEDSAALPSSC